MSSFWPICLNITSESAFSINSRANLYNSCQLFSTSRVHYIFFQGTFLICNGTTNLLLLLELFNMEFQESWNCSILQFQEPLVLRGLLPHSFLYPTGEGNGNPLQCSCLENPRDGGAWWAAIYGVVQSRTRLKRLSSSSSSKTQPLFC